MPAAGLHPEPVANGGVDSLHGVDCTVQYGTGVEHLQDVAVLPPVVAQLVVQHLGGGGLGLRGQNDACDTGWCKGMAGRTRALAR